MFPITRASMQSFCRTCLKELEEDKDQPVDLKDGNLKKFLHGVLESIVVDCDNSYPHRMCNRCHTNIRMFYEFREKSYCATMALKQILEEGKLTTEARRNLQNFCRLCLKRLKSPPNADSSVENEDIRIWVWECTDLIVAETDLPDFPKSVCNWCHKKMRNFTEFRSMTKQTYTYLNSIFGEDENQTETLRDEPDDKKQKEEIVTEIGSNVFAEQLPILKSENDFDDDHDESSDSENSDGDFGENDMLNFSEAEEVEIPTNMETSVSSIVELSMPTKVEPLAATNFESTTSADVLPTTPIVSEPCIPLDVKPSPTTEIKKVKSRREGRYRKRKISVVYTDNFSSNDNSSSDDEGSTHKESDAESKPKPKRKIGPGLIKCEKCEKKFQKRYHYEAHVLNVHEGVEKPYTCKQCPNAYRDYGVLQRHLKDAHLAVTEVKNNVNRFMCKLCSKVYKRKHHLKEHMQIIHEGLRPYKCNDCDKTFGALKTLRVHELMHTGALPFKCEFCQKSFKIQYLLNIHLEQHTTRPELLCPVCKRASESEEALKEHMTIHTSRHFQCSLCGKRFKKHAQVREHEDRTHLKIPKYKCRYCAMPFVFRNTCRMHELKHTEMRPGNATESFEKTTSRKSKMNK